MPIIIEDMQGRLYCITEQFKNSKIKSIWALDIPKLTEAAQSSDTDRIHVDHQVKVIALHAA